MDDVDDERDQPMSSAEELAAKRRREAEWAERAAEDEKRTRAHLDARLLSLGFHCLKTRRGLAGLR